MRKNPYYRGPRSDHFDGLRFFNTPVERENGLADVLRWRFEERYRAPWPARIDRPPPDRPPERVA
ncbi:MAG: hypothetical protein ACLPIC_05675, partial [Rhodoblastus sp.]